MLCLAGCATFPEQASAPAKPDVEYCFQKTSCIGLTHEQCLFLLEGCSEAFK